MSLLTRMVGFFGCDFWMAAASERIRLSTVSFPKRAWPLATICPLLKRDFQFAAVGQFHPFTQAAVAAEAVEHPRHGTRVLAEFGGFALETVNFLDDFDGDQDIDCPQSSTANADHAGGHWCQ